MYSQIYKPKDEKAANVITFPNHTAIEKMKKLSADSLQVENKDSKVSSRKGDFDTALIVLIAVMLADMEALPVLSLIPLLLL